MPGMKRRLARRRLGIKKLDAIRGLGGNVREASNKLGITQQAVYQWPPVLTDRLVYQVIGALVLSAPAEVQDQVMALLFGSNPLVELLPTGIEQPAIELPA